MFYSNEQCIKCERKHIVLSAPGSTMEVLAFYNILIFEVNMGTFKIEKEWIDKIGVLSHSVALLHMLGKSSCERMIVCCRQR